MAANDKFYSTVKTALDRDNWIITDPFRISAGGINYAIDFGAEKLIGAEREGRKIAVEVKSFSGESDTYEFHKVVGQFIDYRIMLEETKPEYTLYIAIASHTYHSFFQLPFIQTVIQRIDMKLLIFDEIAEVIEQWRN
ncbi:MAG: XisH family protein [Chloroflexota bacterium]